jgi:uncharacterized protein YprB with RNaseH-like and TPR domain
MTPRDAPPLRDPETELTAGELTTPHGLVWWARARYPGLYRHGRVHVAAGRQWQPDDLARVAREPRAARLAPERWVVLDVETTGLGARAGTYAFLVGLGWWDADAFIVEQFLMRDPSDEPALLHAVAARFAGFAGLVSFNGKSFDAPLLSTRFAMARQPAPHTGLVHCDMLHAARRVTTREAHGGSRLAALEKQWLGVRRHADIAGRDVPDVYMDYLRTGSAAVLDGVLRHNRIDILSLSLLTAEIARFVPRTLAALADPGGVPAERLAVARIFDAAGDRDQAESLYEACLAPGAPLAVRQGARQALARSRKGQGDLAAACTLWESMLEDDPDLVEPCEELAKAFEHRLAAPGRALERVAARLAGAALGTSARQQLLHRRQRLERKVGNLRLAHLETPPADGALDRAASQPCS